MWSTTRVDPAITVALRSDLRTFVNVNWREWVAILPTRILRALYRRSNKLSVFGKLQGAGKWRPCGVVPDVAPFVGPGESGIFSK